jgi:hypothetical protein
MSGCVLLVVTLEGKSIRMKTTNTAKGLMALRQLPARTPG